MYLTHFGMSEWPFSLTPNTDFYCALKPHHEAMEVLVTALNMGEGFIKVTGEVGTGKTLLCRKVLEHFTDNATVAYIANSYLNPHELRWAIAKELQINVDERAGQQVISQLIQDRLLELNQQQQQVVLIIDEAQCLSWDALEAVRLITNLETNSKKLLQVVLFGQPELDEKLSNKKVRQLRQRISFSYQLRAMTKSEVVHYIHHRLSVSGVSNSHLFSKNICLAIAKASRGIPRLVNILCHKVLLQSFGEGKDRIEYKHINNAIKDTEDCEWQRTAILYIGTALTLAAVAIVSFWRWSL